MGERLAEEAPVDADLVMPIPDSGTPAAIGFAKASGIPYEEGLIKNRYVGRTFIQPDQELRRQGIRLKFNPLDEIAGKRVVIVDDSIVRGNTMQQLVAMLFDARRRRGARADLVAARRLAVLLRDRHGRRGRARRAAPLGRGDARADRRHLAPLPLARRACSRRRGCPTGSVCRACFTREYPTQRARRRPHEAAVRAGRLPDALDVRDALEEEPLGERAAAPVGGELEQVRVRVAACSRSGSASRRRRRRGRPSTANGRYSASHEPGAIRVLQPVGRDRSAADERLVERVVAVRAVVGEERRDLRLVVARPGSDVARRASAGPRRRSSANRATPVTASGADR